MGKDPAALLYIDKWIAATQGMKGDAKGWFLDLILHQYNKGSLPADIDELASICRIRPSEFQNFEQVFKQVLEQKFKQNETGRLENGFAKEIIQGREAFKEKRSHSGKWSYLKKFVRKHYGERSQDEWKFIYHHYDFSIDQKNEQVFKQVLEQIFELYINVNEDVDIKKNKKERKKKTEVQLPFHSEQFSSTWNKWIEYRKEINKPYRSALSEKAALAKLGIHPESVAIEMIENSIANQWQGIFELKNNSKNVRSANQRTTESVSAGQEGFGSFG